MFPQVINESVVDAGALAFQVEVYLTADYRVKFYGEDGVVPTLDDSYPCVLTPTFIVYVSGSIYSAGSLLTTDGTGSIPLSYDGSLVTDTGVVVDDDVFTV